MASGLDFGVKWNLVTAGDFGFAVIGARGPAGEKVVVLQLDTALGRFGIPFNEENAKILIRRLEETVTGLILPPA